MHGLSTEFKEKLKGEYKPNFGQVGLKDCKIQIAKDGETIVI